MDLDSGALRDHRTSSFVQLLNFKGLLLDETLLDELFNFVSIGWNARKLVNKVAIADQVHHRHMLNSEQLSNFRVCINVDVKILELSIMCFDSINQHGFEDVAGTAPGSTSLNQDGALSVLERILPVSLILHLLNVRWLTGGSFVGVGGCI